MSHLKIGIFDSGIGGLTVARAMEVALPGFSFVYFGDTAHLPYGEKSPDLIRKYASGIARHLVDWGCGMVVVACNSASSNALDAVRHAAGPDIPVLDVISPVVREVRKVQAQLKSGHLRGGVIGTRATIDSGIYQNALSSTGAEVHARSTPLLASAIEEGFAQGEVSEALLQAYFGDGHFDGVDLFVLGCTHYPLVSNQISQHLPDSVRILDTPSLVAQAVKQQLPMSLGLSSESKHAFYVSDLTAAFAAGARQFFGEDVALSARPIWRDTERNPSA